MRITKRTLVGIAVACVAVCVLIIAYNMGDASGRAAAASRWSRLFDGMHRPMVSSVRWSVTAVEGDRFILNNPRGTMVFKFESHTVAADALQRIRDNHLSDNWFIFPETVTSRTEHDDVIVTGLAWRGQTSLLSELLRIGVLVKSGEKCQ